LLLSSGISWGENAADSIGKKFSGEIIRYEVGFWIFFPVGGGEADFRNLGHGNTWFPMKAKPRVCGWLTSYRGKFIVHDGHDQ